MSDQPADVRLRHLFKVFGTIGLVSFGGGVSGWMYREIVETRRWMPQHDFLTGMALARTMPGVNVVNLAIWIGHRLRGGLGAVAAVSGVLAGPLVLIILCAMAYQRWGDSMRLHQVLLGITAAALGMSWSMGFTALPAVVTHPVHGVIVVVLFIGVGVLHWPMLPLVAAVAPASIAWAYFTEKSDED